MSSTEFSVALDIVNNSELDKPIGALEELCLPREIRPSHIILACVAWRFWLGALANLILFRVQLSCLQCVTGIQMCQYQSRTISQEPIRQTKVSRPCLSTCLIYLAARGGCTNRSIRVLRYIGPWNFFMRDHLQIRGRDLTYGFSRILKKQTSWKVLLYLFFTRNLNTFSSLLKEVKPNDKTSKIL